LDSGLLIADCAPGRPSTARVALRRDYRPISNTAKRIALPLPAVMDLNTFQWKFAADEACWEHLRSTRWGATLERFTCPDCGRAKGWWLANRRLVECCERRRQTI